MADNKQAVVFIHGVGEQKPMETLRRFVEAVWTRDNAIHDRFAGHDVWSKPDNVSESFELRRLTTPQNTGDLRTDFFEFYWAHLMEGTGYGHVVSWARSLLIRHPATVPRHLRLAYALVVAIAALAVGLAIYALVASASQKHEWFPPWASALMSVGLVPLLGVAIRQIVGDAARYLHPAPTNIQSRHSIRLAGVKLLEELHKPERKYRRIIIVGHSLGSIIGYDILTHAWVDYHRKGSAAATEMSALDALERLAIQPGAVQAAEAQAGQRRYFEELKKNGSPWRVTDFVTLGSPLAHAALLMAKDADNLAQKQKDREFPTCLPTLETLRRAKQEVKRFSFELAPPKPFRVPHHAGVFAVTRWTNLYFPSAWIVKGDLVGGPLAGVFGPGVRDVALSTTERWGLFSHTLYWKMPASTGSLDHILQLRQALDLTDVHHG